MLSGKLNRGSLLVKASSGIRGHAYNYSKKKKEKKMKKKKKKKRERDRIDMNQWRNCS